MDHTMDHKKEDLADIEKGEISHVELSRSPGHQPQEDARGAELGADAPEFVWTMTVIGNALTCSLLFLTSTFALSGPLSVIGFIAQAFPEDAGNSAWIAAALTIPNCVLQTFTGMLTDIFGRKHLVSIGLVIGIAGSIISSRAQSMNVVIGGQVLSSVGVTFGYLSIPMLAEVVPKEQRGAVLGGVSGIVLAVAAMAPIVAGAGVREHVGGQGQGWRLGFYLAAALFALALLATVFIYKEGSHAGQDGRDLKQKVRSFDWTGVILAAAGLVLFQVGLQYGNNPYPWKDPHVLGPLIAGVGVLLALAAWEVYTPHGILDHDLWQHRNFTLGVVLAIISGIVLFGGGAFIPQMIIAFYTNDAVKVGVYNLPFNLASGVSSLVSGYLLSKYKEAKWILLGIVACITVGEGLMILVKPGYSVGGWIVADLLIGAGAGSLTPLVSTLVSLCTPDHLIASAVSIISAFRAFGGSIGVAIFSIVLIDKSKTEIPKQIVEKAIEAGLPPTSAMKFLQAYALSATGDATGAEQAFASVPGISPSIIATIPNAVGHAMAAAYRLVWIVAIPFSALAIVAAIFLKSTREQMTKAVISS